MNCVFNEQILADKLSKLDSSAQCIETLSHWCIFHRKKAELVVQTWDKQFHSSQKEQKVPFLYLANDILQNSRRKGTEFVSEFWKVLPAAIKDVFKNGDDHGKNVVSRLVKIWEERRVFGSRAHDLKGLMLGNEPPPTLEFKKKRSRSVKIMRRDSRSVKIKLAIGGTVEKIVSAFHAVISEHPNESSDLSKCKAAVHHVGKMEKDVDTACAQVGDPRRATLAAELQDEETLLKQCIQNLQSVGETRMVLVSQLKEALKEQESELENVRTQLQVAQVQIEEATFMRKRLNNETVVSTSSPFCGATSQTESGASAGETPKKSAAAIAAEVADKLAASTSSQQIMTSVLSTFAAEAAKNAGLITSKKPANSSSELPIEKRPKLEESLPVSGATGAALNNAPPSVVSGAYQQHALLIRQQSVQGQASTSHRQYTLVPAMSSQQFLQQSAAMMIGVPYGYSCLPPPPPVHAPLPQQQSMPFMNMERPATLPQQHSSMSITVQQPPLTPQQPVPLAPQQPSPMTPQQSMAFTPQPMPLALQQPAVQQQHSLQQQPTPIFRPLQPPKMAYYSLCHQPH